MVKEKKFKNSGVLIRENLPTDYIAGVSSKVDPPDFLSDGNWKEYLPLYERQSSKLFDTFACVSFSALNCIETIMNFYVKTGKISDENFAWLIDKGYIIDGKFECSDRFTAKMSGTTTLGNYAGKVGDSIRHDGVVPEFVWKWDQDVFTWEKYYEEVPKEIKDIGKEFSDRFDIYYEFLPINKPLKNYLKKAPIQVLTAVCGGWINGDKTPVPKCSLDIQHATMIYGTSEYISDFDHYEPFEKRLSLDYPLPYQIRYYIKEKNITNNEENSMLGYKFGDSPVVYVNTDGYLVSVLTWEAYVALGGTSETIVNLEESEKKKFKFKDSVSLSRKPKL